MRSVSAGGVEVSARTLQRPSAEMPFRRRGELAPVESVVMYSGNVEVRDEVEVLPKVSGQLLELKVDMAIASSKVTSSPR